jgi:type VII secretion protein EssA
MKEWIRVCSVAALILGGTFQISLLHPKAETNFDHSGKLLIQTDRIGQDETERVKAQDQKETELEQMAPDLFTKKTQDAVKAIQQQREDKVNKFKGQLFTGSMISQQNNSIQNLKKALFTKDYKVQPSAQIAQSNEEDNGESLISKKLAAFFTGFILLLCGGIYVIIQKTLE